MSGAELTRLVHAVYAALPSDPFSALEYRKLADFAAKNNLADTLSVIKASSHFEAPTPQFVQRWTRAIDAEVSDPAETQAEKASLWAHVSAAYPTSEHLAHYIDHHQNPVSVLSSSYAKAKDDFASSQVIFHKMVRCYSDQNDWFTVKALYDARMKTPHKQLQQTFEELSSIVSAHFPDQYTDLMRIASKQLRQTEKNQRYFERIEQDLAQDPDSPQQWASYMESVSTYADKSAAYPSFLPVFFRSFYGGNGCKMLSVEWVPVWATALRLCHAYPKYGARKDLALAFLAAFPERPEPFSELLYCVSSLEELEKLRSRIDDSAVLATSPRLAQDIVLAHARASGNTFAAWSVADIRSVSEMHHDTLSVAQTAVAALCSKQNFDAAVALLQGLCALNKHRAEFLAYALGQFSALGCQNHIATVLHGWHAEIEHYDSPSAALDAVSPYVLLSPNAAENRARLAGLRARFAQPAEQPADADKETDEDVDMATPPPKKSKSEAAADEPARSREQFRVKIAPVPDTTTEKSVRDFLAGYAEPRSVAVQPPVALVELSSEREVLACLARDVKLLDGQSVGVARVFGTTVWLTNYPAAYGEAEIAAMIRENTQAAPAAIRLPSQSDGRERRFCYVDFADEATAGHARSRLDRLAVGGHELRAEISNPSLKKARPDAAHQIRLHNMDFTKTTEGTLRQFFAGFGAVESVHVPLSEANRQKGYANNGYGFVTFASEGAVQQALALQAAEIDGRRVEIAPVAAKSTRGFDAVRAKQAGQFRDQHSITVRNVAAHATRERLQEFLEAKVGAVARLQLKPSRRLALVEFDSVGVCGRAGFVLPGCEFEGGVLDVGPKSEFLHEPAQAVPMMVSPMLMRRRRK